MYREAKAMRESDLRMTLKNGFGECSLFVLSANGSKDQNIVRLVYRVAVWRQSEVSIDF